MPAQALEPHRLNSALDGQDRCEAMIAAVRSHPVAAYLIVTFVGFWSCIALGTIPALHFWVPILGALAPAMAALVVTGLSTGEVGIRVLVRKLGKWRCNPAWYLVVFGLPASEALVSLGIANWLGVSRATPLVALRPLGPMWPALWVVFLFAAVEELGWRGFVLPKLLASGRSALVASLVVGSLHELWHWPLILLPHQMLSDVPIVAHSVAVVAEAMVLTWVFRSTGGSVLMVALFHGSGNIAMVLYDAIDPRWMPWFKSGMTVLATAGVLALVGPGLESASRRKTTCGCGGHR
jgi:CAAX protease family protein